ncbi:class I SAM-dependent methyltransferase [Actinocorallia aurea]
MWALGDYAALAEEVIADLGPVLVAAAGVGPGDTVLDVAAGSGNAAIPAARTGARVVASDLTPELLAAGRKKADAEGLALEWREADAEALPFDDDSFDAVLSCVGVMFAPHHERAAAELLRVCRPGGTIALLSWTPEGFIGQMFAAMRPYAPPPPPGVQPPPLWGDYAHVDALLGDAVTHATAVRRTLEVPVFETPESFRDYFKSHYGPTITTYRAIAADPSRVAALDDALADLGRRHLSAGAPMEWEYLLLTAEKAKP